MFKFLAITFALIVISFPVSAASLDDVKAAKEYALSKYTDAPDESTPKIPTWGFYRVDDKVFSIGFSRFEDTITISTKITECWRNNGLIEAEVYDTDGDGQVDGHNLSSYKFDCSDADSPDTVAQKVFDEGIRMVLLFAGQ